MQKFTRYRRQLTLFLLKSIAYGIQIFHFDNDYIQRDSRFANFHPLSGFVYLDLRQQVLRLST